MSIPKAECKNCENTYYGWSLLYSEHECEECGQKLEIKKETPNTSLMKKFVYLKPHSPFYEIFNRNRKIENGLVQIPIRIKQLINGESAYELDIKECSKEEIFAIAEKLTRLRKGISTEDIQNEMIKTGGLRIRESEIETPESIYSGYNK